MAEGIEVVRFRSPVFCDAPGCGGGIPEGPAVREAGTQFYFHDNIVCPAYGAAELGRPVSYIPVLLKHDAPAGSRE